MAESKEELKSLLIKVKEESIKVFNLTGCERRRKVTERWGKDQNARMANDLPLFSSQSWDSTLSL